MRVLFTTRGSAGHLGPLVPYATACRSAGHDVLVAAQDRFEANVSRTGLPFAPLGAPPGEEWMPLLPEFARMRLDEGHNRMVADFFGGKQLPRWADEGACTTMEHSSEVSKQERMLIDFMKTGRGIPFSDMFAMKEYPHDVMPLYSQGHSLAEWLIEDRGRAEFLKFLADGMKDEDWRRAVHEHYGFNDLYAMQIAWLDWVKSARPRLTPETTPCVQLSSHTTSGPSDSNSPVLGIPASYRGQSPNVAPADRPVATNTPAPTAPLSSTYAGAAPSGGSVYAAAMARAAEDHQAGKLADTPAYDASRSGAVIRR